MLGSVVAPDMVDAQQYILKLVLMAKLCPMQKVHCFLLQASSVPVCPNGKVKFGNANTRQAASICVLRQSSQ